MGHSVVRIDPEFTVAINERIFGKRIKTISKTLYQHVFYKLPAIRNRQSRKICKKFEENNDIDLTLVVHDFLNREEVTRIKKITNSPICLWFPDALSNFRQAMFFVAGYDLLFFCDKYIAQRLKMEFNLPAHFLPQCFNPLHHKPVELTGKEFNKFNCDITNAGNLYTSRAALYRQLLEFDIKLWGHPPALWLNVPELDHIVMNVPVHDEEKSKAFQAAKIVLNNMHPAVIDGINKRAFEIPGCGAFQITSYRDAVCELFEDGKEVVTYKSLEELKSKIKYYLAHDEERKQIAEAGYQRAISEHTYRHRLEEIFDALGRNSLPPSS